MPPQTIKNQNSTSFEVWQENPQDQLLFCSCTSRTGRLLENRGWRKWKSMPNTNQTENNCFSLRPPTPSSALWAGELGPSPAAEDLFILHPIKGNQALFWHFGWEGVGTEGGPEFKLKTRSTSLNLLVLFLWLLNGPHCTNQAFTIQARESTSLTVWPLTAMTSS